MIFRQKYFQVASMCRKEYNFREYVEIERRGNGYEVFWCFWKHLLQRIKEQII
jgi:hypothetical protein